MTDSRSSKSETEKCVVCLQIMIEGDSTKGLGRDNRRRAGDDFGRPEGGQGSEVEQLASPVSRHPHVGGAQIAVQEAASVQQ